MGSAAEAEHSRAAKVAVGVSSFAGLAMLDPRELPLGTYITELKDLILAHLVGEEACHVHILHGDEELQDWSTLERFQDEGSVELVAVLRELTISDSERKECVRMIAEQRTREQVEAAFKTLEEAARADKKLALQVVGRNGSSLRHAHSTLKADKQVVLRAVAECGEALEYAHCVLKADRDVVLTASRRSCKALVFADAALRADGNFILESGRPRKRWNPEVLQYACDSLWTESKFIKAVARRDHELLKRASTKQQGVPSALTRDKGLVLEVVGESPEQLCHADDSMKRDVDVVLKAVGRNGEALRYAHEDLKKDRRVVAEAARQNPHALRHAHPSLQMTGRGGRSQALKELLGEPRA